MRFNFGLVSEIASQLGQRQVCSNIERGVAVIMSVGLFILISGKVWIESSSARTSQVYIWLLLPALLLMLCSLVKVRRLTMTWVHLSWLAYIAWVALSTLWADLDSSEVLKLAKRGLFIALFLYAVDWLMINFNSYLRRSIYLGVIIVGLGALAILLYQIVWLSPDIGYRTFRLDRLGLGDFVNYRYPLAAGLFHGAAATLAFSAALDRRNGAIKAGFWLVVFAILVVMVFFTYARGAWLGIALAACISIMMTNSKRGWWCFGLGAISVLVLSIIWREHLLSEIFNRKLSGRSPIWDYYFEVMSGHWLIGFGLGTPFEFTWADGKTISPHAHSLFLQQIYDSGLVSLILFLLGLVGLAFKGWQFRHNEWIKFGVPALAFAVTVMLTDVERVFTRPNDYWTIFWLPVAIVLAVAREKSYAKRL